MTDEQRAQFDELLVDLVTALDTIDREIDAVNLLLLHRLNCAIANYNWVVDGAVNYCSNKQIDDRMILCRLDPEKTLRKMDAVRESLQKLRELVL